MSRRVLRNRCAKQHPSAASCARVAAIEPRTAQGYGLPATEPNLIVMGHHALTEAVIYLDGLGSMAPTRPEERAALLIEQLAARGYVVREPASSPLRDQCPAYLKATRQALGLRIEDVAREARVSISTVKAVEDGTKRSKPVSIAAVAYALDRLGAGKQG